MEIKQWINETARLRLTDQDIAEMLNITRKTANKRLRDGLTADDLISICEHVGINKTLALVELGKIPHDDVLEYLDSEGQLVETASDGDLAWELAKRLNPISKLSNLAPRDRGR